MDVLALLMAKGIAVVVPPSSAGRKTRKDLSADALYALVRNAFGQFPDHRHEKAAIPLADALSSAFAMFSLKDPSLLAFDQRRNDCAGRLEWRVVLGKHDRAGGLPGQLGASGIRVGVDQVVVKVGTVAQGVAAGGGDGQVNQMVLASLEK